MKSIKEQVLKRGNLSPLPQLKKIEDLRKKWMKEEWEDYLDRDEEAKLNCKCLVNRRIKDVKELIKKTKEQILKEIEKLKRIIENDCAIKKYPNRSYSDYDKGREAGYNWILKKIDEIFNLK